MCERPDRNRTAWVQAETQGCGEGGAEKGHYLAGTRSRFVVQSPWTAVQRIERPGRHPTHDLRFASNIAGEPTTTHREPRTADASRSRRAERSRGSSPVIGKGSHLPYCSIISRKRDHKGHTTLRSVQNGISTASIHVEWENMASVIPLTQEIASARSPFRSSRRTLTRVHLARW